MPSVLYRTPDRRGLWYDLRVKTDEYLRNPCEASSLPFWKAESSRIRFPKNVIVTRKNDDPSVEGCRLVSVFFKMINHLDRGHDGDPSIETISQNDWPELADQINESYADQRISISQEELIKLAKTKVFDPYLCVKIVENDVIAASGIALFDKRILEGSIEWVQVLPKYRRMGFGRRIVEGLLCRVAETGAGFVTVSGKIDESRAAEKTYRSCGFVGNTVWRIYKRAM